MPTVPQYHRSVSPQVIPDKYIDLNVNQDMFGGKITEARANLGNAINNFNSALINIKDRIDDTKLIELKNKSSEWMQTNYYDKDNGYLYKTGKDAYGQSEALMKDYDKYMSDFVQKSGFSPAALKRANQSLLEWRMPIQEAITNHDFREGINWSNTEATTALQNYSTSAVNSRNNPDEISKSLESGYQIIEWQGEIQHLDRPSIDAKKIQYRNSLNENILSAYLGEGSLKASEFFEQHKNEISPDKIDSFTNAVKQNELTYTARTMASNYVGLPIEQVYSQINSIPDPQTRDAVMREYNVLTNQMDAVQREKDAVAANDIMQQVFQLKDSGGSISDIMTKVNASDMSLEMKNKIFSNLQKMQEFEQYGDQWADYNYLIDLAATDHERFLKITPATYNLTKEQYNKITEMQRKGADVQYTPEAQIAKIVKEFNTSFGWQKPRAMQGNGLYADEYERELVDFLSLLEKKQGKAFDVNHIDEGQLAAIKEGLGYKNPNETNTKIDEVKELWMRAKKHGDFKSVFLKNYQLFKQINKKEPQPEEMYELAKRSYNFIETEYKQRGQNKIIDTSILFKNINNTTPLKGETKALTYLADAQIPAIGRELGVKYTYVKGARYRQGSTGNHGKGLSLDVSMSEHKNPFVRTQSFEEFAALPNVVSIGTSDPIILKQFAGNSKIKNLTAYDLEHGTNHKNHMHITVDSRFGGVAQGK